MFGSGKTPKGPSFKNAIKIVKEFSGEKLTFWVPESTGFSKSGLTEGPDLVSIRDKSGNLCKLSETSETLPYGSRRNIHESTWKFSGIPLLQDYLGQVNLVIDLVEVEDIAINDSLFSADRFIEQTQRFIEQSDLSNTHDGFSDATNSIATYCWPNHLSPTAAKWKKNNGVSWLSFESIPLSNGADNVFWLTPLSERHYLSCRFVIVKSAKNAGNAYRQAEKLPSENFRQLIDTILDSLKLELSESTRVKHDSFNASQTDLSNFFPPEKDIKAAVEVVQMWSGIECDLGRVSLSVAGEYLCSRLGIDNQVLSKLEQNEKIHLP